MGMVCRMVWTDWAGILLRRELRASVPSTLQVCLPCTTQTEDDGSVILATDKTGRVDGNLDIVERWGWNLTSK